MIVTTIKIHCRSGKRRVIVQTIKGLAEQLVLNGECLKAELYQGLDDKETFYIIEEWQTWKALEKYKSLKSLAVLLGLETLLAESVEIKHTVKL